MKREAKKSWLECQSRSRFWHAMRLTSGLTIRQMTRLGRWRHRVSGRQPKLIKRRGETGLRVLNLSISGAPSLLFFEAGDEEGGKREGAKGRLMYLFSAFCWVLLFTALDWIPPRIFRCRHPLTLSIFFFSRFWRILIKSQFRLKVSFGICISCSSARRARMIEAPSTK